MTQLTHTGWIYRSIVIARFRDWLLIWLSFSHVLKNVKCINFLPVFRLPALIMVYWRWSESTWSVLARLPHHCLVSSASPSGSWIRRGGDFLPRSITDPDHVSIKHTAAAWLSCPNSETDSFSVLCLQIPVDLLVSVSSGGNVSWCPDSIIIVASASQLSAGHGSVKLKTVRPSSQSPSAARCCHTGIWPTKTKTCQLSAKKSNWQKERK